jgi:SAM-dependent methyltransferase
MSRFGPDPRVFFDSVYNDVPPWDVDGPQPAMTKLLAELPAEGPVLDLGCGSGDLALFLARQGLEVLGIDFVEVAILQAREKAAALPVEAKERVTFEVADGLRPTRLGRSFGAVVDSGFFHLFTPNECDRLVDEVAYVLQPGGRYYLHAFATEFEIPNTPRAVPLEEVRTRFGDDPRWRLLELRAAEFASRIAPVPATIACIERT